MPDSSNQGLHEEMERLESRLSEDIREIRMKLNDNGEAIVKLETLYGTLVKLPDTIDSLKETVVGINTNLTALNDNIESIQRDMIGLRNDNKGQDEQIEKLNKKGTVNWIDFITDNFWKIWIPVGIIYLILKDMLQL